jgi:thiamine biosynthesis lipoprotein
MTAVSDETVAGLLRFTQQAMATTFEIVFPWGTSHADRAADAGFNLIHRLESQLTVFRDTSEVSRLNRIGHKAAIPVETGLFRLLHRCEELSRQTGGAFDITSGPLTRAWGFFARQGRVPTCEELTKAMGGVGSEKIKLDETRSTVRFAQAGVEINLGSIGKGYALDRVGVLLQTGHQITDALLHAGTSSVLAIGEKPWTVGVRHPRVNRRLGSIKLSNRAMAASGAVHQHFDYNGRRLGHVLDPRTGRPAEEIAIAVAIANSAADADALATAFYVMEVDGTIAYCAEHPDVSAVLVTDQSDAKPVAVNIADEWTEAGPDEVYVGVAELAELT